MAAVDLLVPLAMRLPPPWSDQRASKKIIGMADRGINTRRDQPFIHKPLFVNRNIRRNNHGIRRCNILVRKSIIDADRAVSFHLDRRAGLLGRSLELLRGHIRVRNTRRTCSNRQDR